METCHLSCISRGGAARATIARSQRFARLQHAGLRQATALLVSRCRVRLAAASRLYRSNRSQRILSAET
eukprot:3543117-Pleurochrysis_carterae.AAC.3